MAARFKKEEEVWQACDLLFSESKALTYQNIFNTVENLGVR
jgi:hypothetical protein